MPKQVLIKNIFLRYLLVTDNPKFLDIFWLKYTSATNKTPRI